MKLQKETTVAFIGDKIITTPNGIFDANLENVIRTELQFVIDDLITDGKCVFLTGIEQGFDMLASEVILECAERIKSIELYAVIPFAGHELSYSETDKLRYKRIYEAATDHIYINKEGYSENSYAQRTDFLLTNSSEVIVYDNGCDSQLKKLTDIANFNIYDELQAYFAVESSAKQFLQDYPNVSSFRYGREGIIFEGNNQPYPVNFNQIAKIERVNDFLCFFLNDGLKIFASLTTDECNVTPVRISGSC